MSIDVEALAEDVAATEYRVRRESERNRGCRFVIYADVTRCSYILKHCGKPGDQRLYRRDGNWHFMGWPLIPVHVEDHWHIAKAG